MRSQLFHHPVTAQALLPLTYLRTVGELRLGIFSLFEKWEKTIQKYSLSSSLNINVSCLPVDSFIQQLQNLEKGDEIRVDGYLLACNRDLTDADFLIDRYPEIDAVILRPWHIFQYTADQINYDVQFLNCSEKIKDPHTIIYNSSNVFVEEGVDIKASIINAERGPVYLGKNSVIQEGVVIQGPFALGEGSTLNVGAKVRPACSIGPYCKVGGEVSNVVFQGFSNKGHDGFLGNAVVMQWCNFGADSNCSNLKNNYSNVRVYSYLEDDFIDTNQQFCGVIMGDHSKTAINTMLNTGTVVGISSNVFGNGFPEKHIPSFSWGFGNEIAVYDFHKAIDTAQKVMARRGVELDTAERNILESVYKQVS